MLRKLHYCRCALIRIQTKNARNKMDRSCNSVITGFLDFLEKKPNIVDVIVRAGQPSTPAQLTSWEESHRCKLPEDLKQFYLTNDGLLLQWSYNNVTKLNIGRINISCLSLLKPIGEELPSTSCLPSLLDLDYPSTNSSWYPSFQRSCQIFVLDFCPAHGHICLVFSEQAPCGQHSVWLLDLSLYWHYLCSSFSDYLRLAIAHLGLRQWPYALTSIGLSPQHEKWFHQFIPKRLELNHSTAAAGRGGYKSDYKVIQGSCDDNSNFTNSVEVSKLMQLRTSKDKRSRHLSSSTKKQSGK